MVQYRLPDLLCVKNYSCLQNVMHAKAWITFCGREILFSGANQADILSSNIIESWLKTISQFRHLCVQRSTIFCDAKYNILRKLSSFVNDGLFLVICLNWRLSPSMMFVVYIILQTSGEYGKNMDSISQFSSQLFTQDDKFCPIYPWKESGCS